MPRQRIPPNELLGVYTQAPLHRLPRPAEQTMYMYKIKHLRGIRGSSSMPFSTYIRGRGADTVTSAPQAAGIGPNACLRRGHRDREFTRRSVKPAVCCGCRSREPYTKPTVFHDPPHEPDSASVPDMNCADTISLSLREAGKRHASSAQLNENR